MWSVSKTLSQVNVVSDFKTSQEFGINNICIVCSQNCETFSEFDDQAAPFEPTIIDRSVHLSIKLFNAEGGEVKWKVKGERLCKDSKMFTRTPIDVEEEIIKRFTI